MSNILKLNSSGPNVADPQRALQTAGFNPGSIDGFFGNGTEAAVLAYQRSAGLAADGIVGPENRDFPWPERNTIGPLLHSECNGGDSFHHVSYDSLRQHQTESTSGP